MKTKRFLQFLMCAMLFTFLSCDKDNSDDDISGGINSRKGVHKIEVTVSSESNAVTTVLAFAGIGKDGINANAALYDETGNKCGDGSYTRTIENGVGKYVCYTSKEATGLMCSTGVVALKPEVSGTIVCVAYINDKEVSRIERTFSEKDRGNISIQTFVQD